MTLTGGLPGTLDGYDDDDEDDAAVDDDDEVRRDASAITSGQFLFHGVLSFVSLAFCVVSSLPFFAVCSPPSACVSFLFFLYPTSSWADECRRPIVISIIESLDDSMLDVLSC